MPQAAVLRDTDIMLEWTEVSFLDDLKLRLVASEYGIREIQLSPGGVTLGTRNDNNRLIWNTKTELEQYFAGNLREFHVPLEIEGTAFQKAVWNELLKIPYGETRSYGDIARAIRAPQPAPRPRPAHHGQLRPAT